MKNPYNNEFTARQTGVPERPSRARHPLLRTCSSHLRLPRSGLWRWPLLLACLVLLSALYLLPPPATVQPLAPRETVVLLHGLNRSHRSMARLARSLTAAHYTVITCDYPSRSTDIHTLATNLFATLTPQLASAPKVHFVTHSMGGVLLRTYLQDHTLPKLGRVVMLAPPNRGSEVADALGSLKLYRWINGPAGCQLGTGDNSFPLQLKPPNFALGVIAGDRSINPFLSLLIPGRDDGKVSVARAQTEGMQDFLCLPVTHTFMMRNPRVIQQTQSFLKTGRFQRREAPSPESHHMYEPQ